jgi:hypothetical protein
MSGTFDPIKDLLKRHADIPRPWRAAIVEDVSGWSASGAAFIGVRVAGDFRQAVYRDGRQPLIGETVYVALTDTGPAPYLALPLPGQSCSGFVYVSAHDVSGGMGGEWAILRVALSTLAWTRQSASPVAGTWDRRPLRGIAGYRLFTYGCSDDGTGSQAWRSDDGGATWTAITGLTGVLDITPHSLGLFGAPGAMIAVGDNGNQLYTSGDFGTTWTPEAYLSVLGHRFVAAAYVGSFSYIAALATTGTYGGNAGGVDGPFTPASADGGAILRYPGASSYWVQIAGGTNNVQSLDISTAGLLGSGDITSGNTIGGGPHAGSWLGTKSYLWTDGDGGEVVNADALSGNYRIYRGAENHPAGLTVGVRGFVPVAGSGDGVQPDDWPPSVADGCRFVALDDDDPAHALYAVERGGAFTPLTQSPDPWARADNTMAVDLGATYAASMQGVATLEIWNESYAHGL